MVILELLKDGNKSVVLDNLMISVLHREIKNKYFNKTMNTAKQIIANKEFDGILSNKLILDIIICLEEYKTYSDTDIIETFIEYYTKHEHILISKSMLSAIAEYRDYLMKEGEWQKSDATQGTAPIY